MKIALIDCADSFTCNLAAYLTMAGGDVQIIPHTNVHGESFDAFSGIVFSPGPGLPFESPQILEVLDLNAGQIPVLGICLGLQTIVHYYGGVLERTEKIHHGEVSECKVIVQSEILFHGLPQIFSVGRYHSWCAQKDTLPEQCRITCVSEDGTIMGIQHRTLDIRAVQFHPESILTPDGQIMIDNWIQHVQSLFDQNQLRAAS